MPRLSLPAAMALMLLCFAPMAQAQQRDWLMSGAELLQALRGDLAPEIRDDRQRRVISSARASAYIMGVADAVRGAPGCPRAPMLPHEMSDRVHTFLSDLPPARLQQGAARLVAEALPC